MSPALGGGFFTRMSGDQESMAQVRRHMPITVPKREVSRVTLSKILLCDQEQEGIFLKDFREKEQRQQVWKLDIEQVREVR